MSRPDKPASGTRQRHFGDPQAARELLESIRWPEGPVCPHCGSIGQAYKLEPRPESRRPVRRGVYKCAACRRQFTVTVGTIFEGSKVGLDKWLYAIHLMCASEQGVSAHQLHRQLDVQYKTARLICHRIRKAMEKEPIRPKFGGVIEADDT